MPAPGRIVYSSRGDRPEDGVDHHQGAASRLEECIQTAAKRGVSGQGDHAGKVNRANQDVQALLGVSDPRGEAETA